MSIDYDVVVIGSGPAGLTAGIYCGRARLNTVIMERSNPGGAIVNAYLVENFPAFPQGISGADLVANMMSQAMNYGVKFEFREVISVDLMGNFKIVNTTDGSFMAKTVIIASGARPRRLGVAGEEELIGRGISFCAMCDGEQFASEDVAIIGGGEGGVSEGLYMTRIASKVTIIEVTPTLNAPAILQERVKGNTKVDVLLSTQVKEITEAEGKKCLRIKNIKSGEESHLKVSGIFILIGVEPNAEYLCSLVELDKDGFVRVRNNMETSIPGIFAAGDIRSGSARQAIAAAGDGAVAALSAQQYVSTSQS
ncbi:MAG: NAD(P)/FAD-dependent oxidoreductase [Chloroflexota bacterium]